MGGINRGIIWHFSERWDRGFLSFMQWLLTDLSWLKPTVTGLRLTMLCQGNNWTFKTGAKTDHAGFRLQLTMSMTILVYICLYVQPVVGGPYVIFWSFLTFSSNAIFCQTQHLVHLSKSKVTNQYHLPSAQSAIWGSGFPINRNERRRGPLRTQESPPGFGMKIMCPSQLCNVVNNSAKYKRCHTQLTMSIHLARHVFFWAE